jgi:hypothetical protein
MKPIHRLKAVLFLSLLLMLVGCKGMGQPLSPLARSVQARELYTSTLHVLTAARAAGKIDDSSARQIETARIAAASAIDLMEGAATQPNPGSAFEQYAELFNRAIDELLRWRVKVEGKPG